MATRGGMKVPDGIEYVWSARMTDGSVVENFAEVDGALYEIGFWTLPPKKIRELFVISANGQDLVFRADVSDPDVAPIWFKRRVIRLTHGGGEEPPTETRFIEGYYFGFRKISTNEKFLVKLSPGGTIEIPADVLIDVLADDGRAEIERAREESLRYRFKRWRARRGDRRATRK